MAATPIDEIESWSKKLSPWRQDCLRRLATQNSLTESDFTDLLAIIRDGSKLSQTVTPPTPIPFERKHFSGGNSQPLILKGIAEVQNVNRLQSSASLSFSPFLDRKTVVVSGVKANAAIKDAPRAHEIGYPISPKKKA